MDFQHRDGWIEVITGCMFAGKTEELLRRIRRCYYAKKTVISFRPKIDDRYSKDEIVSHNNSRIKTVVVSTAKDIYAYLDKQDKLPYAIAIDEVQFFDDEIVNLCEYYANNGVRVIVAGLNADFRGEPFGVMPELIARAEEVTKLAAICQVCGAPATKTQRLINGKPANYDDPVVLVGASEQYEARCRHCHDVPGKPSFRSDK